MNKLYGLLTAKLNGGYSTSYYMKRSSHIAHTMRSSELCDLFLEGIEDADLRRFACLVCYAVLASDFGEDIKKLDANNTYFNPGRDPELSAEDVTGCVYQLIKPAKEMNYLLAYLDSDIRDRLSVPEWADIAGAVCLQLLRETA